MTAANWINETLYPDWGQRFLLKRELARTKSEFQEIVIFESASHGTQDNPHSGNFLAARMGVLRALESVFMEVSEGDQRTLTASFRVKYCVLTRAPDNLMQPIPLAVATLEDMLVAA